MLQQMMTHSKALVAQRASVWSFTSMKHNVSLKMVFLSKPLVTEMTLERFDSPVDHHVPLQRRTLLKGLETFRTLGSLFSVCRDQIFGGCFIGGT